jgi:hypothetical protein
MRPGILLDIKGQKYADNIQNIIDIIISKEHGDDKSGQKDSLKELSLGDMQRIFSKKRYNTRSYTCQRY